MPSPASDQRLTSMLVVTLSSRISTRSLATESSSTSPPSSTCCAPPLAAGQRGGRAKAMAATRRSTPSGTFPRAPPHTCTCSPRGQWGPRRRLLRRRQQTRQLRRPPHSRRLGRWTPSPTHVKVPAQLVGVAGDVDLARARGAGCRGTGICGCVLVCVYTPVCVCVGGGAIMYMLPPPAPCARPPGLRRLTPTFPGASAASSMRSDGVRPVCATCSSAAQKPRPPHRSESEAREGLVG